MKLTSNLITLNLNRNAEVSAKDFIAPIEYTQYNFHVEWGKLASLSVAELGKQYPASIFCDFLPKETGSVGSPWEIGHAGALELLK